MTEHDGQDDLALWPATRVAAAIRERQVSPVEVTEAALRRIERDNAPVNAFVTVLADQALARARVAEDVVMTFAPESLGALHGVPVSVKDLTPTAGVRTTFGSRHFADHVPDEDALAWARVKAAGAVLVGKTTTPEFGWLAVTESPLTGVTGNPWDPTRTCGGSSGGAAVATALGMGTVGLGSDGAGSLRIPASFCGVVGLKASAGRIPIHGEDLVYATTESMGPLTRTVEDAALMLAVMSGPDEREAYPLPALDDPLGQVLAGPPATTRVGLVEGLAGVPVEPEVTAALVRAAGLLAGELTVDRLDLELLDSVDQMLRFWRPAITMFLDELALEGVDPEESHPVVRRLAEEGRHVSGVDLWQASVIDRGLLHQQVATAFEDADVLLMPTLPLTAFPHPGEVGGPLSIAGVPVAEPFVGFIQFTAPFNMTGHPALSVPAGFDSRGLPIGIQVVGRHGADIEVLQVGLLLQRLLTDVNRRALPRPRKEDA